MPAFILNIPYDLVVTYFHLCDMASKILLISINQCDEPYPVFPLGVAYIASALHRAGHQTRLMDWQMDSPEIAGTIAEFRPDLVGISLRNIDDVLIRKRQTFFDGLSGLCSEIKQLSSCPIILGGSGFSIFPEELLALSGADFGIQGEGEESIVSLVSALEQRTDYSNIAGLVFRNSDRIIVNPRRTIVNPGPPGHSGTPRPPRCVLSPEQRDAQYPDPARMRLSLLLLHVSGH